MPAHYPDPHSIKEAAKQVKRENQRFFSALKKHPPKDLDQHFHAVHEAAFEVVDCLSCANCCKTTGPLFTSRDIERIARVLKLKPGTFISEYLRMDEDGDYVLKSVPCPFLGEDHYCKIYEDRPAACRDYPHTHRRKMHTILDLTQKNVTVCPAVFGMIEALKKTL